MCFQDEYHPEKAEPGGRVEDAKPAQPAEPVESGGAISAADAEDDEKNERQKFINISLDTFGGRIFTRREDK